MNRLFIFHPDCELAIAHGGRFYMPPGNIVQMAEDLAFLSAWLGEKRDYVLVKNKPGQEFTDGVCRPLAVPCEAITESEAISLSDLQGEPWGKSPKICHWLAAKGMGEEWQPEQKEWYSRKVAREGLQRLLKMLPSLEPEVIPWICYTIEDLQAHLHEEAYLAKAPWSSSGKGILALQNGIGEKEKEWLKGVLRRQGYVMLEKKLNKVKDFAMEFYAGEQGVEFIGWSAFSTGAKGEYKGNYLGSQDAIEQQLLAYIDKEGLERLKEEIPRMAEELLPHYRGYFGVDMMAYTNAAGKYCLQPCVEINLRYNMGIVAFVFSRNYLAGGAEGEFTIRFYSGQGEAYRENTLLRQAYPAVYKNNRIESGYLNLTPVTETTHFIASVRCY